MSLRRTTLLTLAGLLTMVGLIAALVSYWLAGREANAFLDLQLRQVAGFVAATETNLTAGVMPPHDREDDFVVETRFADHRPDVCLPAPCRFPQKPTPGFAEMRAGGHAWRVFALALPDRTVQVGQQIDVRREMATSAAIAALLPLLFAIPVVWLVISLVLGRAFRRLARLTEEIGGRDATDTTAIALDHAPSEVRPLLVAMNGLLARLRGLMDQQRDFVADAAHQLRTPLGTAVGVADQRPEGAVSMMSIADMIPHPECDTFYSSY